MLDVIGLRYHPATAAAPVLRDVSLQLAVGAPALVAGRSGSGKTTLLEVLCGLAEADAGRILWQGRPSTAASAAGCVAWCSSSRNAISSA